MINQDVADIIDEMADMEEIEGNRWESLAYRKAASSIRSLSVDLEQMYRENRLREIDGVGPAIEKKIIQYITSGSIEKYLEMKRKYPLDFKNLRRIQGLGPKKIYALYRSIGVKNIEDLRSAVNDHRIAGIPGFGKKSEENLASELKKLETMSAERIPLGRIFDYANNIREKLLITGKFRKVELVGSFRRMRETIGDLDILAVSDDPAGGYETFLGLKEINGIIARGESKTSVSLDSGLNCDFRIFSEESFGAAMQYFTGSKQHNIRLRDLAISQGLKLNEYGLFRGDTLIAGKTEEDVYGKLGLQWIPPELRENTGEIELAMAGRLPTLVGYDISSDMHINVPPGATAESISRILSHTGKPVDWYGAILLSAEQAHTLNHPGRISDGDMENFLDTVKSIGASQRERILVGVELDVQQLAENSLDRDLVAKFDYIVASSAGLSQDDINLNTDSYLAVIKSGIVHAIAHPTGRIIGKISPAPLDYSRLFRACKEHDVWLEINGLPERSDLPADIVRRGRESGVNFVLGSGATSAMELGFLRFAVSIARRGWLSAENVINSRRFDTLKAELSRRQTLKSVK